MSHSDSEGFESAEDDDFEKEKETTADQNTGKPSNSMKTVTNDNSDTTMECKTIDKLRALDIKQEENNDSNDDWGWDDDEDDNFNFDSKPKPKANDTPSNVDSQPAKRPDSIGTNVMATAQSVQRQTSPQIDANVQRQPDTPSAWSPWSGMVSLLSTASTGVASFTSHVSSVIESNIGIPDPEKFAQQQQQEKTESPSPMDSGSESVDTKQANEETMLNLGSFVSNVTSISNRVIAGGLDTLEGIGKKTMTILQENDAGLISKRKLLGLDNEKPVLSQVLREAKEKSEESEKTMKLTQKKLYRKQLHFETLFDDYHGLVHLEALEMLSKQASLKLQALLMPLTGIALNELQQTMNSVNELCELNENDLDDSPTHLYEVAELEAKLLAATEDFDIPIDFKDILE